MMILNCSLTFDRIIDIITAVGVFLALIGLFFNIRTNYLTVMHKCIADYRRIVRENQMKKYDDEKILKLDLLGLFNEQLYYVNKWYLPYEIRKEWKKTMLRHLKNEDENSTCKFEKDDWKNFSRINDFMEENK
ncbi:MAG: hypothetical protein WC142_09180 [Bacteroidales bacterium]|jgi:hypothetical protein|nr:hypothetical protein [Bacteroidales bacterium]MDD3331336.1 hypothetical protein [Bacteroidales bacterium]MDD4537067.1 hypothetical protein [Petrimonas sp.]